MSIFGYDPTTKWLVQNQGRGILFLGGYRNVRQWKPLQAELVQTSRLPDGMLEVYLGGARKPIYVCVEVGTYAEARVEEQALRNLMTVYLDRGIVAEMLVVVLRPKGKVEVKKSREVRSVLGKSSLEGAWDVINMWEVAAQTLLDTGDVGLIPWVPLTTFAETPEKMLRICAERIEKATHGEETVTLLAATQVLTGLRFQSPKLLEILGGKRIMLKRLFVERDQDRILLLLRDKHSTVPEKIETGIRAVTEESRLDELLLGAAKCDTLAAFEKLLKKTEA